MRISTNTIYEQGIDKIMDLQSSQAKLQQQISTGRRILTPADDPTASAIAYNYQQALAVNTQTAQNRKLAENSLTAADGALSSVSDLLANIKSSIINAGNATFSDSERSFLAAELSNNLDQLISLANSKDGNGDYMFSGYQIKTAPFTKTSTGATYNGDNGTRMMQVSESRQLAANETGNNIFQKSGNDIFQTLTNVIAALNTPLTPANTAALNTALGTANKGVQTTMDDVLTTRATLGSRGREIDNLNDQGEDRNLQYKAVLSDLLDLDYAKAYSEVTQQATVLEAAQKSFASTSGMSLFKYI